MSKEELNVLSVKGLRDMAKEKGIAGRWDMTKEQLVDALVAEEVKELAAEEKVVEKPVEVLEEKEVAVGIPKEVAKNVNQYDVKNRMRYVDNAEAGDIVAFRLPSGKVVSAKIEKKSTRRQMLRVETSYGESHDIQYTDVVWVKTGKRWPRGVYNLLKGLVGQNESRDKANR